MKCMKGEEEFNNKVDELATLTPAGKVLSAGPKEGTFFYDKSKGHKKAGIWSKIFVMERRWHCYARI